MVFRIEFKKCFVILMTLIVVLSGCSLIKIKGAEGEEKACALEQPAINAAAHIENEQAKKLIALTFDDGPNMKYTPKVLEVLEKENIKATFFIVGSRVNFFPTTLKMVSQAGHQIGNHTYNHKRPTGLTDFEIQQEISDTAEVIKEVCGAAADAVRTPYGEVTQGVENSGYPIILWSIDTEDWKEKSSDEIYQEVTASARDGDIILMHDSYQRTVDAIAKIIPELKSQGYEFVTVNELIERRRGEIIDGKVYYAVRP